MTSDEDFRVRTDEPTVPGVPLPPTGAGYPVRRRRRGPWLLAILVVLLLAAGTLIVLLRRGHADRAASPVPPSSQPTVSASAPTSSAATSGPTASASPSASASQSPGPPALLPRGKEAPASAIPWAQVNAGWNLRAWSSKANPNSMPLAPSTLYLVNPIGGRYRIATLAPNTLPATWSPDRRRAVMHSYVGTRDTLREYDLSTGRQLASFVLGNRTLLSYAGPGGHSLLLSYPAAGAEIAGLELVSTGGSHQRSLPGSTPASGPFGTVLYRADGSAFLTAGQRGFAVLDNAGRLIRQIGFPAGAQHCRTSHWWTAQVAIGTCSYPTPGNGAGVNNLVLIPVDGRAASAITHESSPHYGFFDAWRFSGGILAVVAGSCGSAGLATIDAAGNSHPYRYRLPAGVAGQANLYGVYADRATLMTGSCGTASRSVISLDLRTGATSALLGPGLNGGSVW